MQQITVARHRWKARHISSKNNNTITIITTTQQQQHQHQRLYLWAGNCFFPHAFCYSSTQWFEYIASTFIVCFACHLSLLPAVSFKGQIIIITKNLQPMMLLCELIVGLKSGQAILFFSSSHNIVWDNILSFLISCFSTIFVHLECFFSNIWIFEWLKVYKRLKFQ